MLEGIVQRASHLVLPMFYTSGLIYSLIYSFLLEYVKSKLQASVDSLMNASVLSLIDKKYFFKISLIMLLILSN
jgi:hypothetical protein